MSFRFTMIVVESTMIVVKSAMIIVDLTMIVVDQDWFFKRNRKTHERRASITNATMSSLLINDDRYFTTTSSFIFK